MDIGDRVVVGNEIGEVVGATCMTCIHVNNIMALATQGRVRAVDLDLRIALWYYHTI